MKKYYFDPHYNGTDWPGRAKESRDQILAIEDPDRFELAMHDLVRSLRTSHTGFFHESVRRVPGRLAIGASFRRIERPDATWMQDWPERGKKDRSVSRLIAGLGKTGGKVIEAAFDGPVNLTIAALSFFDPPTTPAQREQAAENSRDEREAQGQHQIDFSKWTADRAQERQNHEEQQAARDRQREIERER